MGTQPDDDDTGVLAEDELDDKDTEQLLADGELVGNWSDNEDDDRDLLAGDESVGPWSEDDLEFGLKADSASDEEAFLAEDDADADSAVEDDAPLTDMPDSRR
jgi:hypothetical protein